jgi:ribonuclease R
LIQSLKLGDGGFVEEAETIGALGEHVSSTERRAAAAERETVDRFVAEFFKNRVGDHMQGIVSGVAKFGLFVTLEGTASEGLVPLRSLPDDRYQFDEKRRLISGRRSGLRFGMGDALEVIIRESNPISGSLLLDVAGDAGQKVPRKGGGKNKRRRKK